MSIIKEEFLPNCLNYNLLNINIFTEMFKKYEKLQVLKCFLGKLDLYLGVNYEAK